MKNKLICFFVSLLWLGYCSASNTSCANYQAQVNRAVQRSDLKALERLLVTLNRQSDCSISYLDKIKRHITNIAATQAEGLVQSGQLEQAKRVLRQARTMTWKTQVVYGDIAAHRKQWTRAILYFNQALDLIKNPYATRQKPTQGQIKKISQSVLDVQLLAGEIIMPISRSIGIKRIPIPVQFKYGGYRLRDLTTKGKKSAQLIADYLNEQNARHVKLYGHTDERGKASYNKWLSGERAKTVKRYLQRSGGVRARIDTIAKGEEEPLPLPRWRNISLAEKYQRDRRVEFEIVR